MYNYLLLKALGQIKKPILLKRGIIILNNYIRSTLDLAVVPVTKAEKGVSVTVDSSHGTHEKGTCYSYV